MTENKVHHQTKKAADTALAKRLISRESHKAVHEGRLSLDDAKSLGRDRGPEGAPLPVSRISKDDTLSPCLCGCGEFVPRRFKGGHDMRMHGLAREYVRGERDLTPEQLEYVEQSGKLDWAKARVAKEKQRSREKAEREVKKQNASE